MILPDPEPIPEPGPQEPTVLDLFKSVTRDWKSFSEFIGSLIDEERRAAVERAAVEQAQRSAIPVQAATTEPYVIPASAAATFPARSVSAMLLALLGQLMLEPQSRRVELGIILYLCAIGVALWSYYAGEWRLPPQRRELPDSDPLTIRVIPLLLSAVFSAFAFFSMGGNRFTVGNLVTWLLAIVSFVWAVWLTGPAQPRDTLDPQARRRFGIWVALLLAAFGLALFFRMNQLAAIPAEPFSDHAEKLLDVYEVTQGKTSIFFPRNTGREAFQMYWTVLVAWVFGTGISFLSLKIGTVLLGILTLPYVYLLGKELGGPRMGLIALFLFGISYWMNVISRIGLRFPLYPLFTAPTLYYLIRGLRSRNRNDFLLAGLFVGLGLHGYSPFRIVPILVVAAFAIYALHPASREVRIKLIWWLGLTGILAGIVFLPLLRYSLDHPENFSYRAISRLGNIESPLPAPAAQIFLSNLWNGLRMFNWDDGEIWVHSVPYRPALDVVTGALFLIGAALLLFRYVRNRDWRDLFLLVSIPILLMPSVLSLAYPAENPALNRAGAAAIPAVLLAALALDGFVGAFGAGQRRQVVAWTLTGLLLTISAWQNYDLVFRQFNIQFRNASWNSSEMGQVISDFRDSYGETDTVWIVPYPHWVDTRLPGMWAGIPNRDFALFREDLPASLDFPYPKMFLYRPEDVETEKILIELYPRGIIRRYTSEVNASKDFLIFFVEK